MGTEVRNAQRLSYPDALEFLLSAQAVPAPGGIYQERRALPTVATCRLCRDPECQAGPLARRLFDARKVAMDMKELTPYIGEQLDLALAAAELAAAQCQRMEAARGRLEFRGVA